MADDFGFDLGLGSDPFGGGTEGLPQIPTGADPNIKLPDYTGGETGGLSGLARTLTGGGGKGGSSGILGDLGDILKGVAIPAAQLGLSGLGIKSQLDAAGQAKRQAGQLGQMQQIQRESAQPLQRFGTQQLSQASAGKIDPAIQQEIDNLVQAQKLQAQQWFAKQGITDSTMMQSVLREIDNKAEAMKAQVIGMDKNTAIQALQAAMQGAGMGAQVASQEQNTLDRLIAESNRALAALSGSVG